MGMRYVWLDISISQFHTGCKFLAVNYFYVYAAATGGVIYIASVNCPCEPGVFAYGKDIRVVGHSRFRNFHVCKLLAVNSFYVYATAADGVKFRMSYLLCVHRRNYIWGRPTGGWTVSRFHNFTKVVSSSMSFPCMSTPRSGCIIIIAPDSVQVSTGEFASVVLPLHLE